MQLSCYVYSCYVYTTLPTVPGFVAMLFECNVKPDSALFAFIFVVPAVCTALILLSQSLTAPAASTQIAVHSRLQKILRPGPLSKAALLHWWEWQIRLARRKYKTQTRTPQHSCFERFAVLAGMADQGGRKPVQIRHQDPSARLLGSLCCIGGNGRSRRQKTTLVFTPGPLSRAALSALLH